MAIPPTIPTSFVPHSGAAPQRFRSDVTGLFGLLSYAVLGVIFLLTIGVFIYGRVLAANKVSKDNELQAKVQAIDPNTVATFVRLRDRLNSSASMLHSHIAFSGFFSSLEKLLPTTVRFTSLHLSTNSAGGPKVDGVGVAKNFNALAAASTAFASDGRVRDAIFSGITINKDSSVSFSLVATLDPSITTFSP